MTARKNVKKCPKCGTSLGSFWGDLVCERCGWYSKGHHLMLKYVMPLCGIFFLVFTLFVILAEIGFNPLGLDENEKFPIGPIIIFLSFGIFPLLYSFFALKGIRVRRDRGLARSAADSKSEISEATAQPFGTPERQIAEPSAAKHQADMVVGAEAIFDPLAQSKYVDGEETRTYLIMEKMELAEAVEAFPDCDVAYLRAAYPTMNAEDHKNASVALLLEGLEKSVRKSRILSRLSKYYVWRGESEKALGYAVQTLLALQTRPPDDEYLQPIVILKELFSAKGDTAEAARLEAIRPRYALGTTEQTDTMKAVRTLASPQYNEVVEAARHSLSSLDYEFGPKPSAKALEVNDQLEDAAKASQAAEMEAEISDQTATQSILDLLPQPFEWCQIPAGQTKIQLSDPQNPFNMITSTHNVPAFQISKYPITGAQFQVFLDDPDGFGDDKWWQGLDVSADDRQPPDDQTGNHDNHPREGVNWYDAVAFCRWLSARTGFEIRLPTEWEWQWAAQGSDGRMFPWGNTFSADRCNMVDSDTDEMPTPVDRYPGGASPFGVMDMAGNVWEWCLNTYEQPISTSLEGSADRVCRGGNCRSVEGWVTTLYRGGYGWGGPAKRGANGFRIAKPK